MALKAKIAKIDFEKLPADLQAHYKAEGDDYVLDVEGGNPGGDDVGALKRALERTRAELADAKKAADAFKDIDPEKYKAAIAKVADIERREKEEQGRYSEIIASQRSDFEKQIATLTQKYNEAVAERDATIGSLIVDHTATAALAAHKGAVDLLLPHVRSHVRIERDDKGKYVSKVVDPSSGEVMLSKKSGQPHTIETFVAEVMREEPKFMRAFEGTTSSGSGARGNGAGGGNGGGAAIRISREDARDRTKYLAAKALAEEKKVPLEVEPMESV